MAIAALAEKICSHRETVSSDVLEAEEIAATAKKYHQALMVGMNIASVRIP